MTYRVKQFIWALTAKISREEKQFVSNYLTPTEEALFEKLKIYEQKHSIKVAQAMSEGLDGKRMSESIRLGLLHDIGKSLYPIGPIRKSIMVLLDHFTNGRVRKYSFSKMVRCYYEHPYLGYELLKKESGYDTEFLQAIKTHHEQLEEEDSVVAKLQYWDNQF